MSIDLVNGKPNTLGIVIVAFDNEGTIECLLDRLKEQKAPGDAVILVDNHPDHASADIAERHPAVDRAIRSENIGFGAGCNLGAESLPARVDLVFFLNPDALPLPGAIEIIRSRAKREWAGWMPLLVTATDGVNSAGNALHISGLSWVTGIGQPTEVFVEPKEVPLLSGACAVIRKSVWDDLGGFAAQYFMYVEDTDLSLRMRLKGHKLGLLPEAYIEHDYVFDKGAQKWFYEERNRYILILRTWPVGVIVVLLPMLLVMELGLWAVSIIGRRGVLKFRSTLSVLRAIPEALAARRSIQKTRILSSLEFLEMMEPRVDSPLVGAIGRSRLINFVFTSYYKLACVTLRLFSKRRVERAVNE